MKMKTLSLFALAAFIITGPLSAEVLFTDNYEAMASNISPNDQIDNPGRQGGTLATLGYLTSGERQAEIGNTTTIPEDPPSGAGDSLLLRSSGRAYVNYDFSGQTTPIVISFRGLVGIWKDTPDETEWIAFSVGNNGSEYVVGDSVRAILFRANGDTQLFNQGRATNGGSGFAPGLNAWTDYKVVLSDTTGTGSAWGTGGSRADYYVNGELVGTMDMNQLTASEGYIGFTGYLIGGIDNLKIETVPNP